MGPTEQKDLFDIKLSASGKFYIRKFAIVARIIILTGLIISFIHIASTMIRYISFDSSLYAKYEYLSLENKLLPYYTAIYCILFYPQMYFYWQVTKYLRKGLDFNDDETFNKAFRALFRYSVFGLSSVLLSSLSYGFELFIFIKYYLN
jgi:hypothetical protein